MGREATPEISLESNVNTVSDDTSKIPSDMDGDLEIPEGDFYALNSQRLNVTYLQCIANSLSLPMGGLMATTRQLIEGKLIELDREPSNVQIVLQGKDEVVHKMFFGIICTCPYSRDHHEHVTSQLVDVNVASDCSALRASESEIDRLAHQLEEQSLELENTKEQLRVTQSLVEDERRKSLVAAETIQQLQSSLEKEKLKAKRFWRLKCDQQLAHEEALEEKDNEIARLTKFLSNKTTSAEQTNPLTIGCSDVELTVPVTVQRGKAPPVHLFSGDRTEDSYLYSRVLQSGIAGVIWNVCYNFLGILEERLDKSFCYYKRQTNPPLPKL